MRSILGPLCHPIYVYLLPVAFPISFGKRAALTLAKPYLNVGMAGRCCLRSARSASNGGRTTYKEQMLVVTLLVCSLTCNLKPVKQSANQYPYLVQLIPLLLLASVTAPDIAMDTRTAGKGCHFARALLPNLTSWFIMKLLLCVIPWPYFWNLPCGRFAFTTALLFSSSALGLLLVQQ